MSRGACCQASRHAFHPENSHWGMEVTNSFKLSSDLHMCHDTCPLESIHTHTHPLLKVWLRTGYETSQANQLRGLIPRPFEMLLFQDTVHPLDLAAAPEAKQTFKKPPCFLSQGKSPVHRPQGLRAETRRESLFSLGSGFSGRLA